MTTASSSAPTNVFVKCAAVVRRIIGAPDYESYLAHMAARHPDGTPLTREEFLKQRMEDRYSRPGSRCC